MGKPAVPMKAFLQKVVDAAKAKHSFGWIADELGITASAVRQRYWRLVRQHVRMPALKGMRARGLSGPSAHQGRDQAVSALGSVDGLTRPTVLDPLVQAVPKAGPVGELRGKVALESGCIELQAGWWLPSPSDLPPFQPLGTRTLASDCPATELPEEPKPERLLPAGVGILPPRSKRRVRTAIDGSVRNLMESLCSHFYRRHYFAQSKNGNYFHNFSIGPLEWLKLKYGDDFNIVIIGSPDVAGDYYAVPWRVASEVFRDNLLQGKGKRRRWVGEVLQHQLTYSGNDRKASLGIPEWYGLNAVAEKMCHEAGVTIS